MTAQVQVEPDPLTLVAFNRALADHADGLKSYAARMLGDDETAEDVTQDAFLALYRHLHQVPPAAFRPWLFRVARNLCLDQLRRRKFQLRLFRDLQRDDDERDEAREDVSADRPDQLAEAREAQRAIEAAIEQLPTRFREAFLLCEIQGLSYEDAASVLGCPVKTVSTRLFRARQRFRAAVAEHIDL